MKWKEYTIHTTAEAEDLVAMTLMELGVEGVEIEDNIPPTAEEMAEMFADTAEELAPELEEADGTARLKFFLHEPDEGISREEVLRQRAEQEAAPEQDASDDSYVIRDRLWLPEEIEALLENIAGELEAMREYADIGEGRIEISESRDTDWRDNWKQFYKPVFMDGILIKPHWEEIPAEYLAEAAEGTVKVIDIEPGTAFGTGTHESTKLCIDGLRRYIKGGENVLDIGTGSGILGLIALALGADYVYGTELDPACEGVIRENLALNQVAEGRFDLRMGDILTEEALKQAAGDCRYDIITANILAPVIEALAAPGQADRHIKKGGIFLTSGIIDTKAAEVEQAFRQNPAWQLVETVPLGQWVSVIARRV